MTISKQPSRILLKTRGPTQGRSGILPPGWGSQGTQHIGVKNKPATNTASLLCPRRGQTDRFRDGGLSIKMYTLGTGIMYPGSEADMMERSTLRNVLAADHRRPRRLRDMERGRQLRERIRMPPPMLLLRKGESCRYIPATLPLG